MSALVIFAVVVAAAIGIAVFAVEYADRSHHAGQMQRHRQYIAELRSDIDIAERRHAARSHLYAKLVEAVRKELANG